MEANRSYHRRYAQRSDKGKDDPAKRYQKLANQVIKSLKPDKSAVAKECSAGTQDLIPRAEFFALFCRGDDLARELLAWARYTLWNDKEQLRGIWLNIIFGLWLEGFRASEISEAYASRQRDYQVSTEQAIIQNSIDELCSQLYGAAVRAISSIGAGSREAVYYFRKQKERAKELYSARYPQGGNMLDAEQTAERASYYHHARVMKRQPSFA